MLKLGNVVFGYSTNQKVTAYWFKSYEIEEEFTYMTFLYDIYGCKNYAFYLVDPV